MEKIKSLSLKLYHMEICEFLAISEKAIYCMIFNKNIIIIYSQCHKF